MTRRVVSRLIALVLVAALVPACGGGGGGGGGTPAPPAPPPPSGGGVGGPVDDGTGGTPIPGPDGVLTVGSQQASAPVRAILPAPDDPTDVYVGGSFRTYNNVSSPGLVRLNANGTVDTAFAVGAGFVPHDQTASTGYPNGGIGFSNLEYLFGVHALAPAPDGSGDIYVAGRFTLYQGVAAFNIVRLNSDGSRDTSFAPISLAAMNMASTSVVRQVVPVSDASGDIYIVHNRVVSNPATGGVVRLTAAGVVNTAFAPGVFGGVGGAPFELVQPNDGSGDIVVVGTFTTYAGTAANGVVRINANGTIDPVISVPFAWGTISVSPVMPMIAVAAANDGSGDLYIGGSFNAAASAAVNRIVRLNPNGTIDTSFATGSGFNARVVALAMDPGGDLWVGGDFTSYNGTPANRIVRLNPDGSIDASSLPGGCNGPVYELTLAGDGSNDVYVGGNFTTYLTSPANTVCRINGNGTFDAGFQVSGGLDFADFYVGSGVWAVTPAVDGSGDVYVGGCFSGYGGAPAGGLVRLNPDGTRDAGFVTGTGFFAPPVQTGGPASPGTIYAIVARPDGDVFVGGLFNSYNGTSVNGLVRLNADGSIDSAFTQTDFGAVRAIAAVGAGTGDIYVARATTGVSTPMVRMNSIGTIYPGFVVTCTGYPANGITSIAPAANGDVYIAGSFFNINGESVGRVVRLDPDGSRDIAFVSGTGAQWPSEARSVVLANDGTTDVYIGCAFAGLPTRWANVIVGQVFRVNANGSLDTAFAVGSGLTGSVWSLAMGPSNSVYVCGQDMLTYNGIAIPNNLVRLNQDGSRDASFPAGGVGFARPVYAMTTVNGPIGDLVLGGTFRFFGNTTVSAVLALNPDGSID